MINVEDLVPPKLRSQRINETRHEREFGRDEIVEFMRGIVLNEAGVSSYSPQRSSATIELLAGDLPESLSVKVVVLERGY